MIKIISSYGCSRIYLKGAITSIRSLCAKSSKCFYLSKYHLNFSRFQSSMPGRLITKLSPTLSAIGDAIKTNKILLFSKSFCPFCGETKKLLDTLKKDYSHVELDQIESGSKIQSTLYNITGQRTVPSIFFSGLHLGGYSDLKDCYDKNSLEIFEKNAQEIENLLLNKDHLFDYDLAVIGGGSGGLACAKQAASLGARVVIFDYVKPTPIGTRWGIGGTCVNVGCIPKKLFHQASIVGETIHESSSFGWNDSSRPTHDWSQLVNNVQNHIKSTNFKYKVSLRNKKVTYLPAYAKMLDKHTLVGVDDRGKETKVTSKFVVLATGERPVYPNKEGDRQCCITSDDVFSLQYPPGKTLVVGASYVALECAGFLNGFGYDTTVMVRSILLRGFDQEMANKIGDYMQDKGVKFLRQCVPEKFKQITPVDTENNKPGLIEVHYKDSNGSTKCEQFNTVLLAIGRETVVKDTGAVALGIQLDSKSRVIGIGGTEMTHVSNIFAIGDILSGKPQLTPMAIQSGRLLANRLFGTNMFDKCDYSNVATTVFTPLEYGCIGLAEEDAIQMFGDDVDVYHNYIHYLESTIVGTAKPSDYYAKLITRPSLNNKVIGFHVLAPNAGEITQGFALGFRMGANLKDFNSIIGIHPTCAEVFTTLVASKKGNATIEASGC